MNVEIKRLYTDTILPVKMTNGSVGHDVYCHRIEKSDNNMYTCYVGFSVKIPDNTGMHLIARSSLSKYNWILANSIGLLDSDYTGELQFRFRGLANPRTPELGYSDFPYEPGDRIGQIYLIPKLEMDFKEVDKLTNTVRGTKGFGSTGK